MTSSDIKQANMMILEVVKEEVGLDVPSMIMEKLVKLTSLLGTSAELVAQSQLKYDEALKHALKGCEGMSPNILKIHLQAHLKDESYVVNLSQQVNKDVHYAIEGLRSVLSALKEEFKQTNR